MPEFVLDRVENSLGKVENAGYQLFLLFPHFFKMQFFRFVKIWDCVGKIILDLKFSRKVGHFDCWMSGLDTGASVRERNLHNVEIEDCMSFLP